MNPRAPEIRLCIGLDGSTERAGSPHTAQGTGGDTEAPRTWDPPPSSTWKEVAAGQDTGARVSPAHGLTHFWKRVTSSLGKPLCPPLTE